MKWHRRRDGHNDVVWWSGMYSIHVTGETASAKPSMWSAKLNGEWLCGKPAPKLAARSKMFAGPRILDFTSVAKAKLYCWRHSHGMFT